MLHILKNSGWIKPCAVVALVLSVIAVLIPLSLTSEPSPPPSVESNFLLEGYKISVDSETICVVSSLKDAEKIVDELISKTYQYYGASETHSKTILNHIEITKSTYDKCLFSSLKEAEELMGVSTIFGSPTVISKSGKKILLTLSSSTLNVELIETEYKTEYKYVYGVNQSYKKVISEGKKGTIKQIYETSEINGKTVNETLVWESVLVEPEIEVIEIGVTPSMQLASSELAYFIKPYDGVISSDYGYRYLNGYEFHTGIDLVAKSGSCYGKTAVAAADGVVKESGYSSSRGNYIIIEHEYGFSTVYMHFKTRLVAAGDKVSAGDPIGTIGSTGRSTGPHLHFEIRLNGKHTDPENYLSFK